MIRWLLNLHPYNISAFRFIAAGCPCDNWTPSFFASSYNSRNRWCQIVRRTIWQFSLPQLLPGFFLYPYKYSHFYFRITNTLSTQPSWKAEVQKILYLSDHEVSALHTSDTESLDGLAFFPIYSWPGDIRYLFHKSEIGNTDNLRFALFAFENNMSPIYFWIFSSSNTERTLARFPNASSKYSGSFTPSLRRNTYGITSMLPNQNSYIWM